MSDDMHIHMDQPAYGPQPQQTALEQVLSSLVHEQRQQAETQRQTTHLLVQLAKQLESRNLSPSVAADAIPADEAKHHTMPRFSGYPANYTMSRKGMYQLMDTLFQFLQEAEQWMDGRPTNPGRTTKRLVCMLKDEAGTWYRGQVQVPDQPEPAYDTLKQLLTDRYVHDEVKVTLRYELQNYTWSGKVSMREHCEQFHMMANRLAVFKELTMEERWRWFKDSLRTCAQARQYLVGADWTDKKTVTAEELTKCSNKCCAIVDGGYNSTAMGPVPVASTGPVPMDIDQLAVQLQQLRAEPETRSLLLAALGADDRGRGYDCDRAGRPGGSGWRDSTPDRVRQDRDGGGWRARGPDGGGGWRDRAPYRSRGWQDRGEGGGGYSSRGRSPSPGLPISELKNHSRWPRWAMGWTQDRIDRATRAGQCFLCQKERHAGGWLRCPNLDRSRTPSPVRERWGRPNGGVAPRQGQ